MSLSRLFNEFRPLFRMMEEPLGRSGPLYSFTRSHPFDHPFFRNDWSALRPSVALSEEGNAYVVEAEVPGVRKENLQVRIGDNGQSVTIEGSINARSSAQPLDAAESGTSTAEAASSNAAATESTSNGSTEIVQNESSNSREIWTERNFSGSAAFSRTVWLPRPVDESKVSAKLQDGVLTLRIPKVEDKRTVKINIE